MKKITILSIFIAAYAMVSCTDTNREDFNDLTPTNVADVTLGISSTNKATGEGFDVPFTITLPTTYTSDASVEATLKFVGGEVTQSIDIPAGETSGFGVIAMASDDALDKFTGIPVKLSATGFVLASPGAGNPSVFNATSNDIDLTSYDKVQWDYSGNGNTARSAAIIDGSMTALFDWARPGSNDLDMSMFNADTFDRVENAVSGSRWETDIFRNDDTGEQHPDGNYFIAIDFWIADGADLPWKLFFVHPDQKTITDFSGTFTNVTPTGGGGGDFIFPLINFTKSTDANGVVSYTFSQP